jgi:hypothetical protein
LEALTASQRLGCSNGEERDAPEWVDDAGIWPGNGCDFNRDARRQTQQTKNIPAPKTIPNGISIRSHATSLTSAGLTLRLNYSLFILLQSEISFFRQKIAGIMQYLESSGAIWQAGGRFLTLRIGSLRRINRLALARSGNAPAKQNNNRV